MRLLICCLILSSSLPAIAQYTRSQPRTQTRQIPQQAAETARSTTTTASPTQTTQTTTAQTQAQTQNVGCSAQQITAIFDSYCGSNICSNAELMLSVLQQSGIPTTNAGCRGLAFEEIATRISTNYSSMKMSCDLMKERSDLAIEEWSTKYAELDAQKDKAEKSKKTTTAVAIGLGATTLGLGALSLIKNKEAKDARNISEIAADSQTKITEGLQNQLKESQLNQQKTQQQLEATNKALREAEAEAKKTQGGGSTAAPAEKDI